MAKAFKLLRISRLFPSFRSCRSNDDDPHPPTTPQPLRRRETALPSRHDGAGGGAAFTPTPTQTPAYQWRKEEKWHVVIKPPQPSSSCSSSPRRCKIDSDDGNDLFPPLSIPKPSYRKTKLELQSKRKSRKKKKKNRGQRSQTPHRNRCRASTSSTDTRWFTSDDEEYEVDYSYEEEDEEEEDESETLISSSQHQTDGSSRVSVSGVLRRLRRLSSCLAAEGKVRESFAVVKRSRDPYLDFRRSMTEMIREKQIYEEGELGQLLRCFLELNSECHHGTIVRAFSHTWEELFQTATARAPGAAGVPVSPRAVF